MKNVFDEKAKKFDLNTAEQITERACLYSPMAHGQYMAQEINNPAHLQDFMDIFLKRTKEEAFEN